MVGLLAVGGVTIVATHPEYAHAVGRWIVPGVEVVPTPAVQETDPLTSAIVAPGGEASRLLGLNEGPADVVASRVAASAQTAVAPVAREKRDVVNYLSRKYHVNSDALSMLVDAAYATGKELNLDPLLLLSVMAVESGFNPFAESTAGASGLMQLMSKVHRDKLADFGGANIALNPVVNLRVGAVVLKDCIRRGGSIVDGLRLYVGAGTGDDSGYGLRVLQEKDRLAQAAHAARPRIEPIPSTTTARAHTRQPEIDHSLDKSEPKIDEQASEELIGKGSVAAL
jgi:soluble lytic murein transglycosylase-like protein